LVKDASGNVGIGTASPGYKLDVQGGAASFSGSSGVNAIRVAGAGGSWFWIDNATGTTMRFSSGVTAGTNSMSFDSSGNLLFPTGNYQKTMSDTVEVTIFDSPSKSGWTPYITYTPSIATSTRGYKWGAWNNGGTQTEWMRLFDGNLLVGTSTQYGRLGCEQNNNARVIFGFCTVASGYTDSIIVSEFRNYAPNNTSARFMYCGDTSAERMSVRSNGGIANFSGNNVNISDRREKTNFAPAGEYLAKICAIPVQTFNYIDQNLEEDGGLTLGVVAQDVQAVAPELVMESDWSSEKDGSKMRLSIYQTDLQYALMKCIQEQQALITTLTDRITALENK